ncbi:ectonucleotide pyrophosphatase/phosphodiesterase [Olivibacter sitiensis]|uniref:alkaline phosphatase family protein n=1 Tax=Olivibacter sitiensis TaxID=376470 RepID=UPI0004240695|nr:ectonucleotide pyrophosphatase/phosphodiesterase [Olivibacter sitiensis]
MEKCYNLALAIFLWLVSFACFAQTDTAQQVIPNRLNGTDQLTKPYVILISVDGFRYDYMEKYEARHLQQLASKGVEADALLPSFPSVTFPNHYSIVTGMYPAHHGLIGNTIYDPAKKSRYNMSNAKAVKDPSWYGGIPIWTLAEQQHLLSASFYWPGSEAPIAGLLPSYYYPYNEKIPIAQRIHAVVEWLSLPEEKRPHIINFYFPEVDHAGHRYGPDAPETAQAVHFVDSAVYALSLAVQKTGLPVNFVFVSDHGMTTINQDEPINLSPLLDTTKVDVAFNGTIVDVHVRDKKEIKAIYNVLKAGEEHYRAYLKKKVPSKYHYGKKDDRFKRIGDIVLIANAPYYFSIKRPNPGAHGYYVYDTPDMKATFLAWGPGFKEGAHIPAFENIHIYPLLAKMLGLHYEHHAIDGKMKVLEGVLKN